ncbi:MAG: YicC/YloC family endoribonuclease [Phycisphaerales bacterium]|nr:YicC family protein [Phycisphaeraceae bacterium]
MIRSMTGFGEASGTFEGTHYFLEVRSLNNRYFKATIRLPDVFQGLEAEIEAALRRRIARGSITVVATCTDESADAAYSVNHRALSSYIEQVLRTPQVASGQVRLDLGPLLSLPGVLQQPSNEESRLVKARAAYTTLLDKAVDGMLAMRAREGQALLKDLIAQRDVIAEQLETVRERSPQVVQEYELRLKGRIEMMIKDAELKLQPVDLIREIAVYAERSDISEEIMRLGEHIRQYTEMITGTGGHAPKPGEAGDRPVGRTLDFLAQEMLREANTMASKSADSVISRCIVEVKGAIDRIKEQVQNVE